MQICVSHGYCFCYVKTWTDIGFERNFGRATTNAFADFTTL